MDLERPTFIQEVIENVVTNGIGYRDQKQIKPRPSPEDEIFLEYNLGSLLQHCVGRAFYIDSLLPTSENRQADLNRSLKESGLPNDLKMAYDRLRMSLEILQHFKNSGRLRFQGLSYPKAVKSFANAVDDELGFRFNLAEDFQFFGGAY